MQRHDVGADAQIEQLRLGPTPACSGDADAQLNTIAAARCAEFDGIAFGGATCDRGQQPEDQACQAAFVAVDAGVRCQRRVVRDAAVTARVPVRTNSDDRYFTDTYQVMPLHGYTRMFERMLAHPNIMILLNADYREVRHVIPHAEVVFTGPIDEFFEYRFGRLPYRSLEFRFETHNVPVAQQAPVINYPNEQAYTRVTEFKYVTGQEHAKTTLVYEFPKAEGDPYYPVPRPENQQMYRKYQTLAGQTPGVHFLGRLGTYKYYNMDQCVAQALAYYRKVLADPEELATIA